MKLLLTILLTFFSLTAHAIDMDIIAQIESSNNPNAVSFRGAKYGRGKFQVSEVALQDYNSHNRTEIAPEELFCPEVNTVVATWYIGQIKRYLRHFGVEENLTTIIASYNWGIGNVVKWYRAGADINRLPEETKEYILRYNRRTK